MHILGPKWHSKFSPASVFSSTNPQKNSKQKNNSTPFEAHMQETMQFTAYLQGFVNIQDPRHLKTGCLFFLKSVSYFFPIKDENLETTGTKNPWQKVT